MLLLLLSVRSSFFFLSAFFCLFLVCFCVFCPVLLYSHKFPSVEFYKIYTSAPKHHSVASIYGFCKKAPESPQVLLSSLIYVLWVSIRSSDGGVHSRFDWRRQQQLWVSVQLNGWLFGFCIEGREGEGTVVVQIKWGFDSGEEEMDMVVWSEIEKTAAVGSWLVIGAEKDERWWSLEGGEGEDRRGSRFDGGWRLLGFAGDCWVAGELRSELMEMVVCWVNCSGCRVLVEGDQRGDNGSGDGRWLWLGSPE